MAAAGTARLPAAEEAAGAGEEKRVTFGEKLGKREGLLLVLVLLLSFVVCYQLYRSRLERQALEEESEMTEILDDDGNVVLDENGLPLKRALTTFERRTLMGGGDPVGEDADGRAAFRALGTGGRNKGIMGRMTEALNRKTVQRAAGMRTTVVKGKKTVTLGAGNMKSGRGQRSEMGLMAHGAAEKKRRTRAASEARRTARLAAGEEVSGSASGTVTIDAGGDQDLLDGASDPGDGGARSASDSGIDLDEASASDDEGININPSSDDDTKPLKSGSSNDAEDALEVIDETDEDAYQEDAGSETDREREEEQEEERRKAAQDADDLDDLDALLDASDSDADRDGALGDGAKTGIVDY